MSLFNPKYFITQFSDGDNLLPSHIKGSLNVSLHVNHHTERNQTDQSSNLSCISLAQHTSKMTTPKTICIALCQRSAWLMEFHLVPSRTQGQEGGGAPSPPSPCNTGLKQIQRTIRMSLTPPPHVPPLFLSRASGRDRKHAVATQ